MEREEVQQSKRQRRSKESSKMQPIGFHSDSPGAEAASANTNRLHSLVEKDSELETPRACDETDEKSELNYDILLNLDAEIEYLKSFEEQRQKERLELNNAFRNAYNNGDFQGLLSILREHCDPKVRFHAPDMFVSCEGIYGLITFYLMVNEVYPDSVTKFIEKRISSIKTPDPSHSTSSSILPPVPSVLTETVEIIDKFIGTRVIEAPIVVPFKEAMKNPLLQDSTVEVPLSTISQIVNTHLYADENAITTSGAKLFNIICETKITFDLSTNKIIEYTYSILAVHIT